MKNISKSVLVAIAMQCANVCSADELSEECMVAFNDMRAECFIKIVKD